MYSAGNIHVQENPRCNQTQGVSVSVNKAPSTADFNAGSTTNWHPPHPIPSPQRHGPGFRVTLAVLARNIAGSSINVRRTEPAAAHHLTAAKECSTKRETANNEQTVSVLRFKKHQRIVQSRLDRTHLMHGGSLRKEMSQASGELAIGYRYHSLAGERLSYRSNMKKCHLNTTEDTWSALIPYH